MSFIVSALTRGSMSAARFAVHSAGFHRLLSSSPMNCSSGSLLFISDCIPAFMGIKQNTLFSCIVAINSLVVLVFFFFAFKGGMYKNV